MHWIGKLPSQSLPSVELQSLGVSLNPGFLVARECLYSILKASGLESLVQQQLKKLPSQHRDERMLLSWSLRTQLLEARIPSDIECELDHAYHDLCQTLNEEPFVAIHALGANGFADARKRGAKNVKEAVLLKFIERFTHAITVLDAKSLDDALQLTPNLEVVKDDDWVTSGTLISIDPRSGHPNCLRLLATWGLADDIKRKELTRDDYLCHKPNLAKGFSSLYAQQAGFKEFSLRFNRDTQRLTLNEVPLELQRSFTLTKDQVLSLARAGMLIEQSVNHPIELDWGWDEKRHEGPKILTVRQATPPDRSPFQVFHMQTHGTILGQGQAVGTSVGCGRVFHALTFEDASRLQDGQVLVTPKTQPDWEPFLRKAAAIVTQEDTRTSHASILAREWGIPALLKVTPKLDLLQEGQLVTVSCCQGDTGFITDGQAHYTIEEYGPTQPLQLKADLMLNLSMPERAPKESSRPWSGVGLIRSEFIFSSWVRIHPMAMISPERLSSEIQGTIERLCRSYSSPRTYFIHKLSQGIATIAANFWPRPVHLRLCDLKSHEYAKLVGGEAFEAVEPNPTLGLRGAARYLSPDYQPAFLIELEAIRLVRQDMGFENLHLTLPFCRTPEEAEDVLRLMADSGLVRAEHGLQIGMMAELPSNVIWADEFARLFDGFSIGSNDLTQLTLGTDRDNARTQSSFDEIHPLMMDCYQRLIDAAHRAGIKANFCGQIASDDPIFCSMLVEMGIDAISIAPDAFLATIRSLQ